MEKHRHVLILLKKKILNLYIFPNLILIEEVLRKQKKNYLNTILKHLKISNKSDGDNFYRDFYIKKRTNNIFISSKLATSKDLFISNKDNKWITNVYSRGRVHLLRANHDSILTTSKTILKDNSMLNCRIDGLKKYSPKRFIIDKNLSIPSNIKNN